MQRKGTRLLFSAVHLACTALVLAGCSSAASVTPTQVAIAQVPNGGIDRAVASYTARVKPLRGEVFKATNVAIHHNGRCPGILGGIAASFTATGTAAGPYPGTFSAQGSWSYTKESLPHWSFDQTATVKSHGKTIVVGVGGIGGLGEPKVTCGAFGPSDQDDGLNYSGPSSGIATLDIRAGYLQEKFL